MGSGECGERGGGGGEGERREMCKEKGEIERKKIKLWDGTRLGNMEMEQKSGETCGKVE